MLLVLLVLSNLLGLECLHILIVSFIYSYLCTQSLSRGGDWGAASRARPLFSNKPSSSGSLGRMTAKQMKEARQGDISSTGGLGALLDRRGSRGEASTAGEESASHTRWGTATSGVSASTEAMAGDMEAYQKKMNAVLERASHAHNVSSDLTEPNDEAYGEAGDTLLGEEGEEMDVAEMQRREEEFYANMLLSRYGYLHADTEEATAAAESIPLWEEEKRAACAAPEDISQDTYQHGHHPGYGQEDGADGKSGSDDDGGEGTEVLAAPVVARATKHVGRF